MQWYISKLIDTEAELHERIKFYSELSKRELVSTNAVEDYYSFKEDRNDNRCMIVGHTDAAFDVTKYLKNKSNKHYKVYLCVCSMSCEYLLELSKLAADYEFYLSQQDDIMIGKDMYSGCRFLDARICYVITWTSCSISGKIV